jgi:hypothetical protein
MKSTVVGFCSVLPHRGRDSLPSGAASQAGDSMKTTSRMACPAGGDRG